ncbi:MAG TPA: polysaccharide ABC transporter ATP-binding protein [Acidimicrobiales bacterium]|nr:polysaccharide ABC transporter ATP-binding protein [Acidimicrobiales bacterium]
MGDVVITTQDLGKRYRARTAGRGRIRDVVAERRRQGDPFWALRHVDLEVMAGQVTGIIGRNGAGKSTLLKLLSRITTPTEGRAELRGRVGSLLEVGTGFHIDLTGRENVFFSGAVLGMTRAEVRRKFDDIVEFAGVERFIDTPIKHYSSGMQVRLGFAIAAHLEPEIMIVDEVLAVGDEEFQRRCLEKIGEVASRGLAILLVSHDLIAVRSRCDVVHLFDGGELVASGPPQDIVDTYVGQVVTEGPHVLSARGWHLVGAEHTMHPGLPCSIEIDVDVATAVPRARVELQIRRDSLTVWQGSLASDLLPGAYEVRFDIDALPLGAGSYELAVEVSGDGVQTTLALDPSLVIPEAAGGGSIVAARHTGRITRR